MATKYGNNPRILDRAKRSSQAPSSFGKAASPGSGTTPKGHLDSNLQATKEMVARMANRIDPLTGKPQQTGPAHLRARLSGRPDLPERAGGNPGATSQ